MEDREVKQSCVCDKVVCERWYVTKKDGVCVCGTKWCVKDGVWQSGVKDGVSKMVGDKVVCDKVVWKMVCQRWWVTKWCERWCVKYGGWQSGVWKMVGDKVVWKLMCQRWWVTKSCERWCVKYGGWQSGVWKMVCEPTTKRRPSAPPEPAQCHKCHACHAKQRWMLPSPTPATRNEGGCHQVPHLPRKVPRPHRRLKRAQARHQSQPSAISATPVTQNEGGCHQLPHLPHETKVDVNKCHACHAKWRWMSPSATPARPSAPPEPAQCHKRHACHTKRRWMSPIATPATPSESGCRYKCRACHAKRR